jgi:ubiquinone biosynthesis protein
MIQRLCKVIWVVLRYRLDTLIPRTNQSVPRSVRWILRLSPARLIPTGKIPEADRLRMALEQLGPVFIKFGQLLSTRRDLLAEDMADALAKLQDRVPPFPSSEAVKIIEAALGEPIAQAFDDFQLTPIASASVAQVHGATLPTGEAVVVKVVRPGIRETINVDLTLLGKLVTVLERTFASAQRLRLPQVVNDYQQTILAELDMLKEADNGQRLRNNFAESPLLYVPRVYWNWCRANVLVTERIFAVPIRDIEELRRRQTDMRLLAQRGVETFFTQVFVHNFFHADMHPGNIFVNADRPDDPSYIAIDCAIIGSLTEDDQDYIARNLLAFFNRDYAEVVRLHLESGWVPGDTDPEAFEAVIKEVCEPIFAKPLGEISFGQFLVQLFQAAGKFNMEIQPQLVLLQKTLLYIEGLGRQLYPQLDLWETAKPFMESWMAERMGPAAALRAFAEQAPQILAQLPRLPALLANTGAQLRSLEHAVSQQTAQLQSLKQQVEQQTRRTRRKRLAGASLIILASLLLWGPVSESLRGPESFGHLAGLFSALVGSLLLARA